MAETHAPDEGAAIQPAEAAPSRESGSASPPREPATPDTLVLLVYAACGMLLLVLASIYGPL